MFLITYFQIQDKKMVANIFSTSWRISKDPMVPSVPVVGKHFRKNKVVLIVGFGILFAHFSTVECILTILGFLLKKWWVPN